MGDNQHVLCRVLIGNVAKRCCDSSAKASEYLCTFRSMSDRVLIKAKKLLGVDLF